MTKIRPSLQITLPVEVAHKLACYAEDLRDMMGNPRLTQTEALIHLIESGLEPPDGRKPLNNTSMDDLEEGTPDVEVHGDPGRWVCVGKASSVSQGWMKSTKVFEVKAGVHDRTIGCLVQVSTEYRGRVAEALSYVPDVSIDYFK